MAMIPLQHKIPKEPVQNLQKGISSPSGTITLENGYNGIIVGTSTSATRYFMYMVRCSGEGAVSLVEIHKGSNVTLTPSTNTITVTTNGNLTVYDIPFAGLAS